MSEERTGKGQPDAQLPVERVVYIMPEHGVGAADDEISLRELWDVLWRGKWIVIVLTALFAVGSIVYALQAREWYRTEVLLAPADEKSTSALGGQLGGLAALAGVTVGGGGSAEAVAVLESREFARNFIEDENLLRVFFSQDWDAGTGKWLGDDPEDWPDIRDAVKYFHENILSVNQDSRRGLVTVVVEWTGPEDAADWANDLVRRLNSRLRGRALAEAEENVDYLRSELNKTNVVTLQQSIGRLLESELQKLMLARGNEEFAFKVIDAASPPRDRVRPKRALIAVVGTLLGGMLGVFVVFIRHAMRAQPSDAR